MKTVVEVIDGAIYVYRNSEKHFKRIRSQLCGIRIKKEDLDSECNITDYENCHIVIDGDIIDG